MSRIRLIMLSMVSMLLVLAASAVMSASPALAEGEKCDPKIIEKDLVVCVEKPGSKKIEEFEGHLLGTSERQEFTRPSFLASKVLGLKAKIECKDLVVTLIIEDSGQSKGTIEFLNCKYVEPKTCKLSAAQEKIITVKVKGEFIGKHLIKFSPQEGETFVGIETEGCVKETFKVVGSQRCILQNPNVLEEEKTVICEPSGSELKLGKEKAEFESLFEHIEVLGTNGDSDPNWDGFLWAEAES
jgi:hypothetical protein